MTFDGHHADINCGDLPTKHNAYTSTLTVERMRSAIIITDVIGDIKRHSGDALPHL